MTVKFEYVLTDDLLHYCPGERKVQQLIQEELQKLTEVLIPEDHTELIIRFTTGSSQYIRALFLPLESSEVRWVIQIPIHPSDGLNFQSRLPELNRSLFHELVHIADRKVLRENHQVYIEHRAHREITPDNGSEVSISLLGHLLQFFASLRNEGIVLLAERLFGFDNNSTSSDPMIRFKEDLSMALDMSAANAFFNRISNEQISGMYNYLGKRMYTYADVLHAIQLDIIYENETDLLNERIQKANHAQRIAWLQSGLNTDLGEWIQKLMFDSSDPLDSFTDQPNLNALFDLLNGFRSDCRSSARLLFTGYAQDRESFTRLIESKIGEPFSSDILNTYVNQLHRSADVSDLRKDVIHLYELLLDEFNKSSNRTVQLALSYVAEQHDVIDDRVPFFGLQDDWMVLEGAQQFFSRS
jgi:hypothetical protein